MARDQPSGQLCGRERRVADTARLDLTSPAWLRTVSSPKPIGSSCGRGAWMRPIASLTCIGAWKWLDGLTGGRWPTALRRSRLFNACWIGWPSDPRFGRLGGRGACESRPRRISPTRAPAPPTAPARSRSDGTCIPIAGAADWRPRPLACSLTRGFAFELEEIWAVTHRDTPAIGPGMSEAGHATPPGTTRPRWYHEPSLMFWIGARADQQPTLRPDHPALV